MIGQLMQGLLLSSNTSLYSNIASLNFYSLTICLLIAVVVMLARDVGQPKKNTKFISFWLYKL